MFDIHQRILDEDGEYDEQKVAEYIDGLMEEFAESPEAQPVIDDTGGLYWAGSLMNYAITYVGVAPAEMTLEEFNEIVYEIIPRKVSTEADSAPKIVQTLRAFWTFLDRQYELPQAKQILATLSDDAVEELRRELDDPRNFGMAKSIFMAGKNAGYDMTNEAQLAAFIMRYNESLRAGPATQQRLDKGANTRSPKMTREERKQARKARRRARKQNRM